MKGSSRNDLAVYDFDEEEQAVEVASEKMMSRIVSRLKPNSEEDVTKCKFLEFFAPGWTNKQKEMASVSCLDVRERDNADISYSVNTPERNVVSVEENSGLDEIIISSSSCDNVNRTCQDGFFQQRLCKADGLAEAFSLDAPSVGNYPFAELSLQREMVDVDSNDEDEGCSMVSRSPSTPSSDLAENEGCYEQLVSDSYCAAFEEMDNDVSAVTIFPDYVVHGSKTYGESQLTFFPNTIKIECRDARANDAKVVLEWEITDVIDINCQWSESIDAVLIKFQLRATDVPETDVMKLVLAVSDSHWLEKEQNVMSLSARYRDIWNALPCYDLAWEVEVKRSTICFAKDYYTEIMEPFEDVIYPKGDPDAVSLSKRDIELLQPDTFINDTIIDFYIKYLKNNIQPIQRHRFHFFNSFFFRKLADLDKDPGCRSVGREAFLRVRKWTRKVNIFEKDYIFIPVNFNLHWSLIVICHPGEVPTFRDADMKELSKMPCILHMDSIKGSHSGLKNIVQSYLCEEWKEKHPESSENQSSKFSNLRFVSLELPQQENSSDCGLFLLHYVELFLEEAPANFSPFRITKHSQFLSANWFLPAEASLKRSFIRKLIYQLLKDSSQTITPAIGSNVCLSTEVKENCSEHEPVEFISEHCRVPQMVNGNSSSSFNDAKSMTRMFVISPSVPQCDTNLTLHEFVEPGVQVAATLDCQLAVSDRSKCSTIALEEGTDAVPEPFVSLSLDTDYCHPGNPTNQTCSASYPIKDVKAFKTSWSSMQDKDEDVSGDGAASDQREETAGPGSSIPKNCEYIPDSPISSSSNRPRTLVEESQNAIGSFEKKADGNDKSIQESEVTEESAKTADGQNCEGPLANDSSNAMDDKECQEINVSNGENGINKEHQGVDPTKMTCRDHDCSHIANQENPPTSSCQDVESGSDENSADEGNRTLMKRKDEPGTRPEPHQKRQKVLHRELPRRLTRSSARDHMA